MRAREYLQYDMIGLAELIRRREVSASEVLEAALERLSHVNPKINAVTLDLSEQARRVVAGPLSGPLAGVPFLIKEHGVSVAGTATALGSEVFKNVIEPADSAFVAALRKAGVVIIGKTNVPELALQPTTEPRAFGPTRNPWNLDRTAGGSSGGSAAAVAGGIVPAAHGSDGGGSIRGPASVTGLFGVKPSRGRVSFAPLDEGAGGLYTHHAVTRSVRDSALLLDIVSRPQLGDPYSLEPPREGFLNGLSKPLCKLRIAFSVGTLLGTNLEPDCVQAVLDAAKVCVDLGHEVEEVDMDSLPRFPVGAYRTVVATDVAVMLNAEAQRRGRPIQESELEPFTYSYYCAGKQITASEYALALRAAHAYGREMAIWFQKYDVLLNSTMGSTALPLGSFRNVSLGGAADVKKGRGEYTQRALGFSANTPSANLTGQPAMTVPLAWAGDGLPIGVQFTARQGEEMTLFGLAAQIEQAHPWAHKRPEGFS